MKGEPVPPLVSPALVARTLGMHWGMPLAPLVLAGMFWVAVRRVKLYALQCAIGKHISQTR